MKRLLAVLWRWRAPLIVASAVIFASFLLGTLVFSSLTFTIPHQEEFHYRDQFNRAIVFVAINLRTDDGPIAAGQPLNVLSFQLHFFRDPPTRLDRIHLLLIDSWTRPWDYNETGPFEPVEDGSFGVSVQGGQIVFLTPGAKEPWILLEIRNETGWISFGASADRITTMSLSVGPEDAYAQYSSRRWVTLGAILALLWATLPVGAKNLLEMVKLTNRRH